MVEVCLLGALVAIVKLSGYLVVMPGIGAGDGGVGGDSP